MKTNMKTFFAVGIAMLGVTIITSCSDSSSNQKDNEQTQSAGAKEELHENADPMKDKGVGPVADMPLEALNTSLADKGKAVFEQKCTACHKIDTKYVGPALKDVTKRRTPEWIMNMVLNPEEMTKKDPIAKELFETLLVQMTFQNVSKDETREILEYFRQNDSK